MSCYHCGEALRPGVSFTATLAGQQHPVCCAGCKAVAEFIADNHLDSFYRHRAGPGDRVEPDLELLLQDWAAFDQEQYWGKPLPGGSYQLSLIVEGLQCAACLWLLRTGLTRTGAVAEVQTDLATGFASIRWNPEKLPLSRLLVQIQMLGYRPHLLNGDTLIERHQGLRRQAMTRLLVAGLGMMQVMMFAAGLYAGDYQGIGPGVRRFLEAVSMLVATPVVLYSARPFFSAAWAGLKARVLTMDVPVALAVGLAYAASVLNFFRGSGALYFDSVVMFVFLLLLARYIDMQLRFRSLDLGQALIQLLPEVAYRVDGETSVAVPLNELQKGDRVLIPRGSAVPADGIIISGATEVDESLMSGESRPLPRQVGDQLLGGSTNLSQAVTLEVSACGGQSALGRLHSTLLEAGIRRPRIAQLADRIAGWFVTAVLLLTAATAAAWFVYQPDRAFEVALAMLVVTCPCALSLATPAALAAASRRLMLEGVLVSRSSALENLAGVDIVVFDKTGTLTLGEPQLDAVSLLQDRFSREQVLALAAALEKTSEHPLARAFEPHWDAAVQAHDVLAETGGLSGVIAGTRYRLGNHELIPEAAGKGLPEASLVLASEQQVLASFTISDTLRSGAVSSVSTLREMGFDCRIISGDAGPVVAAVAGRLGISTWLARQDPAQKLEYLRVLQQQGHRVLMVGDGVNDAPVLAGADVSMAVSGSTHMARCSADLIANSASLAAVPACITLARRVQRTIRQNLAWAIAYNLVAIPLAATGALAPWMAALGMSLSSLVVVVNASRLARGAGLESVPGQERLAAEAIT